MTLKYLRDRLHDYNINFFVNELVEASKNLGILQAKIDAYQFNSILIPMFHRKEVMSSMDIEGTQRTTLSDICEREVDPKLRDEKESIEIRNHTKALIFGADHLRTNKFTHSFIQEVHKIMMTDVEPANPDKPIGRYKINNNQIKNGAGTSYLSYRKNGDFDQLRVFGSNRMPKFDIDYGTHNGEKSLHIHHFTDGIRNKTPNILHPGDSLYEKYKHFFKGVK